MGTPEQAPGRSGIRVELRGRGSATVDTGLPVLDRLLERLVEYARFDVTLEVEPGTAEAEVSEAGSALGRALAGPLREGRGYGFAMMTSTGAPACVVLARPPAPLLVSNVDLTDARIGGLGTDVARRFLDRFAEGAGVTLHVRLLNGTDTQHVLEAIFKALGVALALACDDDKGDVNG
jgi:imidazoleglycerol-phosphate dehydratase